MVPLVFAGNTSELFELNKMWLTWGLTIVIMTAWITKMITQKTIIIQRTPLDIPLLLFLLSQIISTIFTLDQHISWWGYYSRFNGGLLSTISYILLYYAFVTHFKPKHVFKLLQITLIGGILTALWGFPSHFGYDPTCLIFRGTFDTACWTDDFKPTIRAFSTLGQPAWFAAYLTTLIPIAAAFAIKTFATNRVLSGIYLATTMLFFVNLLFSNTRAGFIAFALIIVLFWGLIYLKKLFTTKIFLRFFGVISIGFALFIFFVGTPFAQINAITLPNILANKAQQQEQQASPSAQTTEQPPTETAPALQTNITDSGVIRKYVWQGAIDAWKANPLFGTGVETFAFAYYQFKPVGHNLTSEWDFLYNKAHNEYLNYLTTTGLFGLGTYLAFIALFLFVIGKWLWQDGKENALLTIGLLTGWISILITNFFGFSVVIMNLLLFLIPLFIFILNNIKLDKKLILFETDQEETTLTNPYQWTLIILLLLTSCFLLLSLYRYWDADVKYALGANYDRVGAYQEAYPLLLEAAEIKPNEPVYKDELAINVSVLATALAQNGDQENAAQFANNAITLSNNILEKHPNNIVFLKNRVRLFYTLAQAVPPEQQLVYYQEALKTMQDAQKRAPTDVKIAYNLGVLYGQTGNIEKGIEVLEQTVAMKPDYQEAYFALGLFYRQIAINESNYVINPESNQKAIETYETMIKLFGPSADVEQSLAEWRK